MKPLDDPRKVALPTDLAPRHYLEDNFVERIKESEGESLSLQFA
jgi:hypothetical protein